MRVTHVAGAGVLTIALAACGGGGDSGNARDNTEGGGHPSPESGPPSPVRPELSGVAILGDGSLTFMDPNTGSTTVELILPDGSLCQVERNAFTADWGRMVWTSDGAVHIGTLSEHQPTYRPVTTITPPEDPTFQGGEITYEEARFSQDGSRVWFEAHPDSGAPRLMSASTTAPNPTPSKEGAVGDDTFDGSLMGKTTWSLDRRGKRVDVEEHTDRLELGSDSEAKIQYTTANGVPRYANVQTTEAFDSKYPDAEYESVDRLGPRTLVLALDNPVRNPDHEYRYGQVAALEITPGGKTKLREIVPNGAAEVGNATVAPDGKTLLLATWESGFFRTSVGTSAQPHHISDRNLDEDAIIIDWTTPR